MRRARDGTAEQAAGAGSGKSARRVPSAGDGIMGRASVPRVVSLQPSATEVLALIGGAHLLVGRSHECDFPADVVKDVPVVTSSGITFESSAQVDEQVLARARGRAGRALQTRTRRAADPAARRCARRWRVVRRTSSIR